VYWLDTNVFIEAKNTYYQFARVPKFWAFLSEQLTKGEIKCCKEVYDELLRGKDDLAKWVKSRKGNGMCVQSEPEVFGHYQKICDWAIRNHTLAQAEEFCTSADGWVVAYAKHFSGTVVTQESRSRKKKVRIPLVCREFQVNCIDTFGLLDKFNPKF
jgi:Domain of unknown function (DUF4411)